MVSRVNRIRSELLALRFRQGDDGAFEELIALWEKPLFYYVRRLTRVEEDAWDVVQEVWLRVFRKLGQLRNVESLSAWLYRIARNVAYNHCRANPEWETVSEADVETVEMESGVNTDFSAEDAQAVHSGLDLLPLAQREVLTLFFLEEFTLQEISSITGAAVGTVKSRLHYGKRALRDIIQRERLAHE